ncbi:MFS general substrate transporter [Delitschia confertaspora ATCC 74209]|uniref:MFS general substrate transporter n=1 Tax=Delitschia confertaspora ATCC 74209 TaxID=1513339 RepID=A0A9P4JTR5_9PLEO|nr:MFS general substrate transporter [Delitschia confertaspora ATCC 74209]
METPPARKSPTLQSFTDEEGGIQSNAHATQPNAEEKTSSADESVAYRPPNGGIKAWCCVGGAFLLQFSSFGYVNACGIFQYHYSTMLLQHKSSSSLAWITTLQLFLLFSCGPVVGRLLDIYGAHWITIPFSLLAIFSLCMLSLCTKYWQILLAQGVGFGIASSGLALPALVLANQWFSTRRGLATGIVASGSGLGGVIFPFMVPRLIDSAGFVGAVRWTALMQGVLLVIANLLIRTPFQKKTGSQKYVGLDWAALESLPWLFFVLGAFFVTWGLFAPFNYLPSMSAQSGLSPTLSQYTNAIANAGSMLGRIIPGIIADRFLGHFNTMMLATLISGILVLAFWIPLVASPSIAGIYIFALMYGFASGGFVSLGPPCVALLCKGDMSRMGVRFGTFCLAIALGVLVGLPIEGAIRDKGAAENGAGGWVGLIIFAGVVLCAGGVFMGITRGLVGGWGWKRV